MRVLYTADGTVNPAEGARGGLPGGLSESFKRDRDGTLTRLPACGGVEMAPGETVVSISSGGGGYGSPLDRDPERIDQVVKLTARNSSQKRTGGWLGLLIRDLVLPFLIPRGIKMGRELLRYRADLAPLEQP